MRKLTIFISGLLLLCSSAWADGVYGTWFFPEQNLGPLSIDMSLVVNQDSVVITAACKYQDGVTSNAEASSKAVISSSSIQTTDSNQGTSNDPNHSCEVSIAPGQMDYTINGDTLVLTYQSQTIQLTRAHSAL